MRMFRHTPLAFWYLVCVALIAVLLFSAVSAMRHHAAASSSITAAASSRYAKVSELLDASTHPPLDNPAKISSWAGSLVALAQGMGDGSKALSDRAGALQVRASQESVAGLRSEIVGVAHDAFALASGNLSPSGSPSLIN